MDVNIQVIARMHSDFATKFGIPRQSGLVEELRSTIVFEPEFRNPDALRGIEDSSGSFPKLSVPAGRLRCVLPGWVVIPGWVSSLPVPPSVPTIWGCPAYGSWVWNIPQNWEPSSMWAVLT